MKSAIILVTIDSNYQYDQNSFDIDEYIDWCLEKNVTFYRLFARNKDEAEILSKTIDEKYIEVKGNVPDDFNEWTLTENDLKMISNSLKENKVQKNPTFYGECGFFGYLMSNGGSERFTFDSPQEAYDYGNKLRKNIAENFYKNSIQVDISNTVVRVSIKENSLEITYW